MRLYLPFIAWLYPLLPLGSTLHRWPLSSSLVGYALCYWWDMPSVVGGLCPLLLVGSVLRRYVCHRWAKRPVVGWYLSSMGGMRGRKVKSEPPMSAPSFYGDGGVRRQCREMGGEIGENKHDFHRVHFRNALAGPPPVFIPPQILRRARTSRLQPSGKERAGARLRWLGPLVIATWFIMLALCRGVGTAAGLDMSSLG